ncbi:hypothetical protein [Tatumella ptyseos]|nr:hypothetical protein [Tatumella ptyseos]
MAAVIFFYGHHFRRRQQITPYWLPAMFACWLNSVAINSVS